jgi:hypothetical protein
VPLLSQKPKVFPIAPAVHAKGAATVLAWSAPVTTPQKTAVASFYFVVTSTTIAKDETLDVASTPLVFLVAAVSEDHLVNDLVGSLSAEAWPTTYNLNELMSLKVVVTDAASTEAMGVVEAVSASFVKIVVAKGAAVTLVVVIWN